MAQKYHPDYVTEVVTFHKASIAALRSTLRLRVEQAKIVIDQHDFILRRQNSMGNIAVAIKLIVRHRNID